MLTRSNNRLRIGLKLAQDAPIDVFRRVWRIADEAGFDHCWAFDHLATVRPDGSPRALFEGWSLLAAMAEATTRTRVGLLVTGMIYRHPALLAKAAVTVDHLSGGRLEFGIGAGWAPAEHDMFGIDVEYAVGRLSEGLEVMKALWSQERSSFDGRHYHLRDAVANPKPVQVPHPPIWIGAGGEQLMLPIVARQADAWHAFGSEEAMARKSRLLDDLAAKAGRDPKAILRSASLSLSRPWDQVRRRAAQLRATGFGYLIAEWPSEGKGRLTEFVEKVMPELIR